MHQLQEGARPRAGLGWAGLGLRSRAAGQETSGRKERRVGEGEEEG